MATSCLGQPSRAILLLQMFTTRMAAGGGPSFAVEKRTPVDEFPIAAVTACPAPRNVPGGLDRPRQVNSKWPRRQAKEVENDVQLSSA